MRRWLALGLLLVLVLAAALLGRDGTGCRPPPDDEPEPACEPTNNTCKAGAPAPEPSLDPPRKTATVIM